MVLSQPTIFRVLDQFAPLKKRNCFVNIVVLLTKIEYMTVWLARVEYTVGTRERLDQTVVPEVFINVERVEVNRVEACEKHVNHYGDINLLGTSVRQVPVRKLLVFDPSLKILVVEVEFADVVICLILPVVVGNNGF